MKVPTRNFFRSFPHYPRATQPAFDLGLAEAMGDLIGSVSSSRPRKILAGYGRD